jgi:predicted nucleic acid-binding protein
VFLDTSGLLCVLDVREEHHVLASELFERADRRVTTNYVLLELVSLMIARRMNQEAMLRFVRRIEEDRRIEFLWVNQSNHRAGMERLSRRLDKTYTLCDAVSFVLMDAHNITDALTTDVHFEQEGFTRLLK